MSSQFASSSSAAIIDNAVCMPCPISECGTKIVISFSLSIFINEVIKRSEPLANSLLARLCLLGRVAEYPINTPPPTTAVDTMNRLLLTVIVGLLKHSPTRVLLFVLEDTSRNGKYW